MRPRDFTALSFDCYGTLIDWEAGLSAAWAELRPAAAVDDAALFGRFGRLEHARQRATPGMLDPQRLACAYQDRAEAVGVVASSTACARFGASVGDWPAFADRLEPLRYVRRNPVPLANCSHSVGLGLLMELVHGSQRAVIPAAQSYDL